MQLSFAFDLSKFPTFQNTKKLGRSLRHCLKGGGVDDLDPTKIKIEVSKQFSIFPHYTLLFTNEFGKTIAIHNALN